MEEQDRILNKPLSPVFLFITSFHLTAISRHLDACISGSFFHANPSDNVIFYSSLISTFWAWKTVDEWTENQGNSSDGMVRGGERPQTLPSVPQKNLRLRGCQAIFFFFFSLVLSVVVADAWSSGQVNDKAIRVKRHQKWPDQICRPLDLITQRSHRQQPLLSVAGSHLVPWLCPHHVWAKISFWFFLSITSSVGFPKGLM